MDISTGSWFKYLHEEILTEGLRDIGLPEVVIDFIEDAMPNAPEKSKMYVGNEWKGYRMAQSYVSIPQKVWQDFMYRNFSDQIQVTPLEPRYRESHFVARIVASYDIHGREDSPPEERIMYDDETVAQNKQIVFVTQNVENVLAKPMGAWRKAFAKALKALSKAGLPSEKVEVVKEELQRMILREFRSFWNRFDVLFAWLNDEPTNYELIKGEESIDQAEHIAQEDLNNKEDPDNIMHTFDDGSYWYNLDTSNCSVEGERMGHCGSDTRGVLVSLRKRHGKRKASSSYITMTWDVDDQIIYQIKGRSNDAPPEETWPAIAWFIDEMDIRSVEETGEHSNDVDGISEMIEWLSQKTTAKFHGNVEERMEAIHEAVNAIDERFSDQRVELEWSSIGCTVDEGEDYGGNANDVYLYMSCDWSTEIDLGWEGFTSDAGDGMYTATLANGDHAEFENIPINTYGSEAREFESDLGLDDLAYEMPGEDPEVEWEVIMMVGAQPDDADMDPDHPQTAHLRIRLMNSETDTANDDNDAYEYDNFADTMLSFDAQSAENMEKMRLALSSNGYIAKSAYDLGKQELSSFELNNFTIYSDDTELEFWFAPRSTRDPDIGGAHSNLISYRGTEPNQNSIPAIVKLYEWNEAREGHIDMLYTKMFGRNDKKNITNDTLNANMARAIQIGYEKQCSGASEDQQQLCFGDKYTAEHAPLVLAKDSRFIVVTGTQYYPNEPDRLPLMNIQWKYTLGVKPNTSAEEMEVIKGVVKFLDENPDIVLDAGNDMIAIAIEAMVENAEKSKKALLSNTEAQRIINSVKSQYGAAADLEGDIEAERRIMIVKWLEDNWGSMNEPEKYVAMKQFLIPLNGQTFRIHGNIGAIEPFGSPDVGKPAMWDELVQIQYRRMGAGDRAKAYTSPKSAATGETLAGTLGEPVPAGGPIVRNARGENMAESVEDQIARIDRMLTEVDQSYDLRIYAIDIGCTIDKDVGGTASETATEIRGIPSVTTVQPNARTKRKITANSEYVMYTIKFELVGAASRIEYRDGVLLPGLRSIRGLKLLTITSTHRTNRKGTIRTVREVMKEAWGGVSNFGGQAGSLGAVRKTYTKTRPTPAPTLQAVLGDWVEASVQVYDMPSETNNMAYHSMVPVEEFFEADPPLVSREFRAPKDAYDGLYQNFIKSGPQAPVYLALGKNGRMKVTGGEDILWFAKQAGLEEVPVFYSYQRQV